MAPSAAKVIPLPRRGRAESGCGPGGRADAVSNVRFGSHPAAARRDEGSGERRERGVRPGGEQVPHGRGLGNGQFVQHLPGRALLGLGPG
jgi:hypothetical protein